MATINKTIRYDLTVSDRLTAGMTAGAKATDRAADAMDAASRSARVLDRALASQRKATDVAAGASLALARADEILKEAEHGLAEGALEAEFALKKQEMAAKSAARQSAVAGAAAETGAGGFSSMGGAMGAAVAAGVALSPVVVTLAAGLGGLGLAAIGVAKNQELMRRELGPLKADYAAFSKSLQPVVLQDLDAGLRIAQHALRDLQPVSQAAGKALAGVLGQIDREFQSKTWQTFFTWMAQQVGPDVQMVGTAFTSWLNVLPGVLEALQPIAQQMLILTTNLAKATNAVTDFGKSNNQVSASVGTNTGLLGFLSKAVANVTSFMKPGGVAAGALKAGLDGIPGAAGKAGSATAAMGTAALAAASHVQSLADAVGHLTDKENKALTPLLNYTNAVLTQRDDANKLNDALKTSHDRIGLATDAQRASFQAAQTYIQDLLNTASAAHGAHKNIDDQIRSIQNALPALRNVKGGTKDYWQEVKTLVGWLHQLEALKLVRKNIIMTGHGTYTISGGTSDFPIVKPNNRKAAGGIITGGVAGRDSVLAMLMPGEVVVPARMVTAGAVDHLRGRLPGFASGGMVSGPATPAFMSKFPAAFQKQMTDAMVAAMRAAIKASAAAAASSGAPGALGGPTSASAAQAQAYARSRLGAYGWGADQMPPLIALWNGESGWNRLARNPSSGAYGIPQALPGSKMGAAANPPTSSAAAQINWGLGYIKNTRGYGSPSIVYAKWLARSPHWYGDGVDAVFRQPTLIGVGERGPEHVSVSPGGGDDLGAKLDRLIAEVRQLNGTAAAIPAATGRHVAAGVGGVGADAAFRRRYPGR